MARIAKTLTTGLAALSALVAIGLAGSAQHHGVPRASITKPIMECPDPHATTWPC